MSILCSRACAIVIIYCAVWSIQPSGTASVKDLKQSSKLSSLKLIQTLQRSTLPSDDKMVNDRMDEVYVYYPHRIKRISHHGHPNKMCRSKYVNFQKENMVSSNYFCKPKPLISFKDIESNKKNKRSLSRYLKNKMDYSDVVHSSKLVGDRESLKIVPKSRKRRRTKRLANHKGNSRNSLILEYTDLSNGDNTYDLYDADDFFPIRKDLNRITSRVNQNVKSNDVVSITPRPVYNSHNYFDAVTGIKLPIKVTVDPIFDMNPKPNDNSTYGGQLIKKRDAPPVALQSVTLSIPNNSSSFNLGFPFTVAQQDVAITLPHTQSMGLSSHQPLESNFQKEPNFNNENVAENTESEDTWTALDANVQNFKFNKNNNYRINDFQTDNTDFISTETTISENLNNFIDTTTNLNDTQSNYYYSSKTEPVSSFNLKGSDYYDFEQDQQLFSTSSSTTRSPKNADRLSKQKTSSTLLPITNATIQVTQTNTDQTSSTSSATTSTSSVTSSPTSSITSSPISSSTSSSTSSPISSSTSSTTKSAEKTSITTIQPNIGTRESLRFQMSLASEQIDGSDDETDNKISDDVSISANPTVEDGPSFLFPIAISTVPIESSEVELTCPPENPVPEPFDTASEKVVKQSNSRRRNVRNIAIPTLSSSIHKVYTPVKLNLLPLMKLVKREANGTAISPSTTDSSTVISVSQNDETSRVETLIVPTTVSYYKMEDNLTTGGLIPAYSYPESTIGDNTVSVNRRDLDNTSCVPSTCSDSCESSTCPPEPTAPPSNGSPDASPAVVMAGGDSAPAGFAPAASGANGGGCEVPCNMSNTLSEILHNVEMLAAQKIGSAEDFACSLNGSWSSETAGVKFNIVATDDKVLSIGIEPPDVNRQTGFMSNSTWQLSAMTPILHSGMIIINGVNDKDKAVASFIGECKNYPETAEIIWGHWLINQKNEANGSYSQRSIFDALEKQSQLKNHKTMSIVPLLASKRSDFKRVPQDNVSVAVSNKPRCSKKPFLKRVFSGGKKVISTTITAEGDGDEENKNTDFKTEIATSNETAGTIVETVSSSNYVTTATDLKNSVNVNTLDSNTLNPTPRSEPHTLLKPPQGVGPNQSSLEPSASFIGREGSYVLYNLNESYNVMTELCQVKTLTTSWILGKVAMDSGKKTSSVDELLYPKEDSTDIIFFKKLRKFTVRKNETTTPQENVNTETPPLRFFDKQKTTQSTTTPIITNTETLSTSNIESTEDTISNEETPPLRFFDKKKTTQSTTPIITTTETLSTSNTESTEDTISNEETPPLRFFDKKKTTQSTTPITTNTETLSTSNSESSEDTIFNAETPPLRFFDKKKTTQSTTTSLMTSTESMTTSSNTESTATTISNLETPPLRFFDTNKTTQSNTTPITTSTESITTSSNTESNESTEGTISNTETSTQESQKKFKKNKTTKAKLSTTTISTNAESITASNSDELPETTEENISNTKTSTGLGTTNEESTSSTSVSSIVLESSTPTTEKTTSSSGDSISSVSEDVVEAGPLTAITNNPSEISLDENAFSSQEHISSISMGLVELESETLLSETSSTTANLVGLETETLLNESSSTIAETVGLESETPTTQANSTTAELVGLESETPTSEAISATAESIGLESETPLNESTSSSEELAPNISTELSTLESTAIISSVSESIAPSDETMSSSISGIFTDVEDLELSSDICEYENVLESSSNESLQSTSSPSKSMSTIHSNSNEFELSTTAIIGTAFSDYNVFESSTTVITSKAVYDYSDLESSTKIIGNVSSSEPTNSPMEITGIVLPLPNTNVGGGCVIDLRLLFTTSMNASTPKYIQLIPQKGSDISAGNITADAMQEGQLMGDANNSNFSKSETTTDIFGNYATEHSSITELVHGSSSFSTDSVDACILDILLDAGLNQTTMSSSDLLEETPSISSNNLAISTESNSLGLPNIGNIQGGDINSSSNNLAIATESNSIGLPNIENIQGADINGNSNNLAITTGSNSIGLPNFGNFQGADINGSSNNLTITTGSNSIVLPNIGNIQGAETNSNMVLNSAQFNQNFNSFSNLPLQSSNPIQLTQTNLYQNGDGQGNNHLPSGIDTSDSIDSCIEDLLEATNQTASVPTSINSDKMVDGLSGNLPDSTLMTSSNPNLNPLDSLLGAPETTKREDTALGTTGNLLLQQSSSAPLNEISQFGESPNPPTSFNIDNTHNLNFVDSFFQTTQHEDSMLGITGNVLLQQSSDIQLTSLSQSNQLFGGPLNAGISFGNSYGKAPILDAALTSSCSPNLNLLDTTINPLLQQTSAGSLNQINNAAPGNNVYGSFNANDISMNNANGINPLNTNLSGQGSATVCVPVTDLNTNTISISSVSNNPNIVGPQQILPVIGNSGDTSNVNVGAGFATRVLNEYTTNSITQSVISYLTTPTSLGPTLNPTVSNEKLLKQLATLPTPSAECMASHMAIPIATMQTHRYTLNFTFPKKPLNFSNLQGLVNVDEILAKCDDIACKNTGIAGGVTEPLINVQGQQNQPSANEPLNPTGQNQLHGNANEPLNTTGQNQPSINDNKPLNPIAQNQPSANEALNPACQNHPSANVNEPLNPTGQNQPPANELLNPTGQNQPSANEALNPTGQNQPSAGANEPINLTGQSQPLLNADAPLTPTNMRSLQSVSNEMHENKCQSLHNEELINLLKLTNKKSKIPKDQNVTEIENIPEEACILEIITQINANTTSSTTSQKEILSNTTLSEIKTTPAGTKSSIKNQSSSITVSAEGLNSTASIASNGSPKTDILKPQQFSPQNGTSNTIPDIGAANVVKVQKEYTLSSTTINITKEETSQIANETVSTATNLVGVSQSITLLGPTGAIYPSTLNTTPQSIATISIGPTDYLTSQLSNFTLLQSTMPILPNETVFTTINAREDQNSSTASYTQVSQVQQSFTAMSMGDVGSSSEYLISPVDTSDTTTSSYNLTQVHLSQTFRNLLLTTTNLPTIPVLGEIVSEGMMSNANITDNAITNITIQTINHGITITQTAIIPLNENLNNSETLNATTVSTANLLSQTSSAGNISKNISLGVNTSDGVVTPSVNIDSVNLNNGIQSIGSFENQTLSGTNITPLLPTKLAELSNATVYSLLLGQFNVTLPQSLTTCIISAQDPQQVLPGITNITTGSPITPLLTAGIVQVQSIPIPILQNHNLSTPSMLPTNLQNIQSSQFKNTPAETQINLFSTTSTFSSPPPFLNNNPNVKVMGPIAATTSLTNQSISINQAFQQNNYVMSFTQPTISQRTECLLPTSAISFSTQSGSSFPTGLVAANAITTAPINQSTLVVQPISKQEFSPFNQLITAHPDQVGQVILLTESISFNIPVVTPPTNKSLLTTTSLTQNKSISNECNIRSSNLSTQPNQTYNINQKSSGPSIGAPVKFSSTNNTDIPSQPIQPAFQAAQVTSVYSLLSPNSEQQPTLPDQTTAQPSIQFDQNSRLSPELLLMCDETTLVPGQQNVGQETSSIIQSTLLSVDTQQTAESNTLNQQEPPEYETTEKKLCEAVFDSTRQIHVHDPLLEPDYFPTTPDIDVYAYMESQMGTTESTTYVYTRNPLFDFLHKEDAEPNSDCEVNFMDNPNVINLGIINAVKNNDSSENVNAMEGVSEINEMSTAFNENNNFGDIITPNLLSSGEIMTPPNENNNFGDVTTPNLSSGEIMTPLNENNNFGQIVATTSNVDHLGQGIDQPFNINIGLETSQCSISDFDADTSTSFVLTNNNWPPAAMNASNSETSNLIPINTGVITEIPVNPSDISQLEKPTDLVSPLDYTTIAPYLTTCYVVQPSNQTSDNLPQSTIGNRSKKKSPKTTTIRTTKSSTTTTSTTTKSKKTKKRKFSFFKHAKRD